MFLHLLDYYSLLHILVLVDCGEYVRSVYHYPAKTLVKPLVLVRLARSRPRLCCRILLLFNNILFAESKIKRLFTGVSFNSYVASEVGYAFQRFGYC